MHLWVKKSSGDSGGMAPNFGLVSSVGIGSDVDSIVADPGAYTREELTTLHSQILSNLEQAWELSGRSKDQLNGSMMQISQVVAREFTRKKSP